MECEEKALRDLLSSAYSDGVGQRILDEVTDGNPVTVTMLDGTTLTLSQTADTLQVLLERFGWKKKIHWTDDRAAIYVLDVCRRIERHFALAEIVARIRDERPEMIMEFASAWGRLIQHKFIRGVKSGETKLYEIASAHQWP
jgi:hypothetical protein